MCSVIAGQQLVE